MLKWRKSVLAVLILFGIVLPAVSFDQPGFSQEAKSIEEKVDKLRETVDELKAQIPKIGYINRQEAFSVFPRAVETERQEVAELEKQMEELNTKAEQGEIDESEYKRQRDLLRAKHLQARIRFELSILETMIQAKGFSDIKDKLKGLKDQTKPMRETMDKLISDVEDKAISPQKVSEILNKVGNNQLKRLNNLLTNLAQTKITQVVHQIAEEKDYDLVIERQNVITYRKNAGVIDDLTKEVKERLRKELRSQ